MAMIPNLGLGSAFGNGYQFLNGRAGGRYILVRRGIVERRIGIDGCYQAIREVIRSAFGLQTRQEFCLEDEHGIMRPLDRNMPLGIYELTINPGVIITFCYARDPNHTTCEVYTKTIATQEDLCELLERNHWIGLIIRGDEEIIDIMDDLQNDVVYHGLNVII